MLWSFFRRSHQEASRRHSQHLRAFGTITLAPPLLHLKGALPFSGVGAGLRLCNRLCLRGSLLGAMPRVDAARDKTQHRDTGGKPSATGSISR